MRHLLPYILNTLLAATFCNFSSAQEDTTEVAAIRRYINYVDSINNLDYAQDPRFLHSVVDGVIKRSGKTVGGYGVSMLMNNKRDSVYRIEYNGGVKVTINKTFYYKSNEIVFARLELVDKKGTFYSRKEFYKDGINFQTDINTSKKARHYTKETALSLVEDGLKFLEDFKKVNSSH